jgi:hypothetical protein
VAVLTKLRARRPPNNGLVKVGEDMERSSSMIESAERYAEDNRLQTPQRLSYTNLFDLGDSL